MPWPKKGKATASCDFLFLFFVFRRSRAYLIVGLFYESPGILKLLVSIDRNLGVLPALFRSHTCVTDGGGDFIVPPAILLLNDNLSAD